MPDLSRATVLLRRLEQGETSAADELLALVATGIQGRARLTPDDVQGLFGAWVACAVVASQSGEDPTPVFEQLDQWRARLPEPRRAAAVDEVALAIQAFAGPGPEARWREHCALAAATGG